jgi:hypothetical protein
MTTVALLTMSAEHVSEPGRQTDDDVLARLTAIDHRLHQISTHLAAVDQALSKLDEVRANIDTLITSLGSTEPVRPGRDHKCTGAR